MAADYSKAEPDEERLARARQVMCDHTQTEQTIHGNTFCVDCGQLMFSQGRPEPKPLSTNELGPIKLDYSTAVGDAKTLNWRKLPIAGRQHLPCPADKPFYVAWQEMPWGRTESRWRVERVEVGQTVPALALWWADDLLGLPPCND